MGLIGYPFLTAGKLTDVDSEARNPLGTVVRDEFGNEYIYLEGAASTVAGDAVTYDEAYKTTRLASNGLGPVAIALAAVVASKFGWYQIGGKGTVNAGTVADNGKVYATATPGTVDDAAVAGDQVVGALFRSADSSGKATIQLNHPWIGVTDTDT